MKPQKETNMKKTTGKLYGIGVGPGDPELISLKAVRILNQVDMVFTASSSKNSYSMAIDIAQNHIPQNAPVKILPFPMTSDNDAKEKAWAQNAAQIIDCLNQGKNAAFLTLGDPMTYSTFGYVLQHIQTSAPQLEIETIPGITSYQAAAARLNIPLVEAEESLLITSGAYGGESIRKIAERTENVVLLKAYKNVSDINQALKDAGLYENSRAIRNCGRQNEEIIDNLEQLAQTEPKYWTLILAKKSKNNR